MLREWSDGKQEVLDELIPVVYEHLRRQAHNYLHREKRNHSFQTLDLINEAYIKLSEGHGRVWESRAHFFAAAAQAMRWILVDHARAKQRLKRGGEALRIDADVEALPGHEADPVDLIALDEALSKLSDRDPRLVWIVELRYFAGLTLEETAETLGISRATVAREWEFAKAWLSRELTSKG